MKLIKKITQTNDSYAPLIARVALGVMIFPHGAQKLLGWFGGYGFTGTMDFFTSQGMPYLIALLPIVAEFFGGLGLIVGLFSRVAAFGVGFTMLVASTMHISNGFFMNWYGQQKGEGIEFFILAIGLAVSIMLTGAGKLSLDKILSQAKD
ncbi:MAG: DoxX family protein [Bdellovibrionaceae bacterium]|nr:DoxX family protein [Pseudobdellovibrionaceae bacterium]